MLIYATGNQYKVRAAKKYLDEFGIDFTNQKVDIIEIQSDNIEEVSIDKARKSFEILQAPLFVNDSGWSIPALRGFPGPYMAYVAKWFEAQDFLNLMKDKADNTVLLTEVVTYFDGDVIETFKSTREGRVLDHIEGEGVSIDQVVTLRKDGKSLALCQNEDLKEVEQDVVWTSFGEWIKNK